MKRLLVDSSVWVDFFRARETGQVATLRRASKGKEILVGDLVLTEVLQGARGKKGPRTTELFLAQFSHVPLGGPAIAVKAASNYRLLRSHGLTVRDTIDVVIATWCIENDVPMLHNDPDMAVMERELGLRAFA